LFQKALEEKLVWKIVTLFVMRAIKGGLILIMEIVDGEEDNELRRKYV